MNYIQEENTISMNGNTTPGSGVPSLKDSFDKMMLNMSDDQEIRAFKRSNPQDLNNAFVPLSKEEGGNLKLTQEDIRYRFCLDEEGLGSESEDY